MKHNTRRWLIRITLLVLVVGGAALGYRAWRARAAHNPTPTTPEAVLAELRAGNARYVSSQRTQSTDTEHDADDRNETATEQHPFAAILCCSDSRLCPEFIFDQRPGRFFEIRNAGNVVDDDVLASLEYAVEHLHIRFILVLGHKGCGAITAVHHAGDQALPDHLHALQEHMKGIRARVKATQNQHSPAIIDELAKANAREQARDILEESEPLARAIRRADVRLMYGLYDLRTGIVEFFDLP